MRVLIEAKGYDPKRQLEILSGMGVVEDYWKEDEDSSGPINMNQADYNAIKDFTGSGMRERGEIKAGSDVFPVELQFPRGFFVVNNVKKEFDREGCWLNRDKVKKLFPDFHDYGLLGDKVEVNSNGQKKIGWISSGYDYGAFSSNEEGVIYRGSTLCAIGTDKSLITIVKDKK